MNPLSIWIYIYRHKTRVMTLWGVAALATIAIITAFGLAFATFIEPVRSTGALLGKFSIVTPEQEQHLDPSVVAKIRSNSDVLEALPASALTIYLPGISAGYYSFPLLGLQESDVAKVLEQSNVQLKEGRLLQPRTNEVLLSEQVATALDLHIGDTFQSSDNVEIYQNAVTPMQVVGILTGEVRLGIVSHEYLSNHELYRNQVPKTLLVMAQAGREEAVDNFLVHEIRSTQTEVNTMNLNQERMAADVSEANLLMIPIALFITIVVASAMALINQMAFQQRLPEFGIMYAAGYGKRWITKRLVTETATVTLAGWLIGIALGIVLLAIFRQAVYTPNGYDLNLFEIVPIALTIPIPIVAIAVSVTRLAQTLTKLDAIAVIERGDLNSDNTVQRQASGRVTSALNPLSSIVFYRRHMRRSLMLTGVTGLMIMAVVLLVFVVVTPMDAAGSFNNNYRNQSGYITLNGEPLDSRVVAQIKSHPSVGRVMQSVVLDPMSVYIPPFTYYSANVYGVSIEDMPYILEQNNLQIKTGRLPQPRTNEIILAEAVAKNRNLQVGDQIGSRDAPIYLGAPELPTEMVVSGIFAQSDMAEQENWLSFASLEFLANHEDFRNSSVGQSVLLIHAKPGQKVALDQWLETELQSGNAGVWTYQSFVNELEAARRGNLSMITLMQVIFAIMAAMVLAILNYIFVSQRRAEFGVLNALGYNQGRLIWRTIREAIFTTGFGWCLSAILCFIALLYLKFVVFNPKGLVIDFYSPTPWLFTIPIPIAVLVASTFAISWSLAKLDPVSIIERQ